MPLSGSLARRRRAAPAQPPRAGALSNKYLAVFLHFTLEELFRIWQHTRLWAGCSPRIRQIIDHTKIFSRIRKAGPCVSKL